LLMKTQSSQDDLDVGRVVRSWPPNEVPIASDRTADADRQRVFLAAYFASASRWRKPHASSSEPGGSSSVNRYYDPSSDQFLSIDPEVAKTGEPYAFTGDDPLNAADPLGLSGWYCIGGQTHFYRGNKYGTANGTCAQVAKNAFNHFKTMLYAYKSDTANARQWMTPTMIANALVGAGFSRSESLDSSVGSKAQHAADQSLEELAEKGVRYSNVARGLLVVGTALNVWADLQNHDSVLYTAGDAAGSLAGGWGGAAAGSAFCGGPEEPAGWVCGVLGGFDGAFLGGKGLGWVTSKL
jgi:RHS repeat-associated protein